MPDDTVLERITYLTGNRDTIKGMTGLRALTPFDDSIMSFLSDLSRTILADKRSREFSDVVTFAFWIRMASISKLKEKHGFSDDNIHLGRGIAFHIAPSNVPVNFAYSLVAGLLTGNANIVRIPAKDFTQVGIIVDAINQTLSEHSDMASYIALVRYGHDREINDLLSSFSDTRVIWGGDETIAEIRRSPLAPRATEITFADRYSLAVIDSGVYMEMADKKRVAEDFYNDTYLTDQNACTSPRIVIWTGEQVQDARETFWAALHGIVEKKYNYQDIQGVNKLNSCLMAAVGVEGARIIPHEDNLVVRVEVPVVSAELMDYKDNSGFFFEYHCNDVFELRDICNDKRCQTIGTIGAAEFLIPLVKSGIKGVDRIVPVGKTMDFQLIWDGYDLASGLTRCISLS